MWKTLTDAYLGFKTSHGDFNRTIISIISIFEYILRLRLNISLVTPSDEID